MVLKQNVVLFPFMAQGHIIPFLALAQRIENKGYNITFVNTPHNIKSLKQSLHPSSSIKLVEIPFNSSEHGLPPDTENCDSLPYHLVPLLVKSSTSLQLPFRNFITNFIQGGEKPVCVISDHFFSWAADVCHEFDIFHAIFNTTGGFGMACYRSVWIDLPHRHTDGVEFQLPDFPEAGKFDITQLTPGLLTLGEDDPIMIMKRKVLRAWCDADAILFNTVEELDGKGLNFFRRKLGIPVWGIGPIMSLDDNRAKNVVSSEKYVEWLDKKEMNSVIYVSFGSQNSISASQMLSLAKALDSSGRNFIWVVRPPIGADITAEFVTEQWLPEGFVERVQHQDGRGLIIEKWAPQLEILAHKAVAVFISHCGWNSVLESLINGVPILGWPMAAEQFYNAKLLAEEIGVCVEVARGFGSEVREQDVVEKIELVMGDNENGKEIRRKSLEIKEMMTDAVRDEEDYKGSSVKGVENLFIAALLKAEAA